MIFISGPEWRKRIMYALAVIYCMAIIFPWWERKTEQCLTMAMRDDSNTMDTVSLSTEIWPPGTFLSGRILWRRSQTLASPGAKKCMWRRQWYGYLEKSTLQYNMFSQISNISHKLTAVMVTLLFAPYRADYLCDGWLSNLWTTVSTPLTVTCEYFESCFHYFTI